MRAADQTTWYSFSGCQAARARGTPRGRRASSKRAADVVDHQVVGVGVALLVVGVVTTTRGLGPDDLDQPPDRLVEVGLASAGSALASLSGTCPVAVAQHRDPVVPDDLRRRGRAPSRRARRCAAHLGVSMAGLRMSPSSPPVQQTSVVRTPPPCTGPRWARPSTPRRRGGRARSAARVVPPWRRTYLGSPSCVRWHG